MAIETPATTPTRTEGLEAQVEPNRCQDGTDEDAPDAVWICLTGTDQEALTSIGARRLAARYAVLTFNCDGAYDKTYGPVIDDGTAKPPTTEGQSSGMSSADAYRRQAAMAKFAAKKDTKRYAYFVRYRRNRAL